MPHVNIKHFPVPLTDQQQSELFSAVTKAVTDAFGCDEGVVSIALEPIDEAAWNERSTCRRSSTAGSILGKVPTYVPDAGAS